MNKTSERQALRHADATLKTALSFVLAVVLVVSLAPVMKAEASDGGPLSIAEVSDADMGDAADADDDEQSDELADSDGAVVPRLVAGIRAGSPLKAAATPYTMTIRYHTNGGTFTQGIAHSDGLGTYHSWLSSSATTYTAATNGYWWGYIVRADGTSDAPRHLVTNVINTSTTDYNLWDFQGWTEVKKTGYHFPAPTDAPFYVKKGDTKIYLSSDDGGTYKPTTQRLNGGMQITSNTTVTAYINWIANTYSVKYNANGGSGTMANSSHTYDTAKALTANAFTRTGYIFSGWNTKADGSGTSYANKASVKNLTTTNGGTVTLYAQWTAAKMTIQYHVNGGTITTNTSNATRYRASSSIVQRSTDSGSTWANYTSSILSTATYKDLPNVGTPGITKTGYHISGTTAWKTTSGLGTSGAVVVSQQNTASDAANPATTKRINGGTQISSNVTKTLYVNWIANTYTVGYDANGGTGTMANSTHTYDTAKDLTDNGFTRTGYNFSGWNTKADGSGKSYANKASVKNLTATNGGTVTLYAQWSEEEVPQLEFTATSEICFVEKADGTLIGPTTGCYIENKSSAPICVTGLAVNEGDVKLCSGDPKSGEVSISMAPEGSSPIDLADFVGEDYTALPDSGRWTIATGARLNLGGLTGKAHDLPVGSAEKTYVCSIDWLVEFAE